MDIHILWSSISYTGWYYDTIDILLLSRSWVMFIRIGMTCSDSRRWHTCQPTRMDWAMCLMAQSDYVSTLNLTNLKNIRDKIESIVRHFWEQWPSGFLCKKPIHWRMEDGSIWWMLFGRSKLLEPRKFVACCLFLRGGSKVQAACMFNPVLVGQIPWFFHDICWLLLDRSVFCSILQLLVLWVKTLLNFILCDSMCSIPMFIG